jgi:hypothetical protein
MAAETRGRRDIEFLSAIQISDRLKRKSAIFEMVSHGARNYFKTRLRYFVRAGSDYHLRLASVSAAVNQSTAKTEKKQKQTAKEVIAATCKP